MGPEAARGRVCHCPGDGPRRPPPPYGPERLYLPISKRQEYLQSSGEKVLASFPVQATIHFYNDASDSEDGEQEDGAQAPRLQGREAQGPPEHGAGAQGRGQQGNGGARSGGSSGRLGGGRPHHRHPPGAGECSSAQ